jgi:peroxiredoxin
LVLYNFTIAQANMSQQEQLQAISANIKNIADPAIFQRIYGSLESFKQDFDPRSTIQVGDKLPSFDLTSATGQNISSANLLEQGHLLVVFYRGSWCPYCNIAVQYLQRHVEDFEARGVTLVAITPELPDYSLSTVEKNKLKFPVLTDLHNKFAKRLGLLYDQSSARELHGKIGVDLNARNGEDTWEVPIPATLLVDKSGFVRAMHVDPDFRMRLDPKVALEWIETRI